MLRPKWSATRIEIPVLSELQRPNILQARDLCEDHEILYCLVIERAEGIDRCGPPNFARAAGQVLPLDLAGAIGLGALRAWRRRTT